MAKEIRALIDDGPTRNGSIGALIGDGPTQGSAPTSLNANAKSLYIYVYSDFLDYICKLYVFTAMRFPFFKGG